MSNDNPMQVFEDLQKDWRAYQETQAQKDAEINAKFDDVVTTDKANKIEASIGKLQAQLDEYNAKQAAQSVAGATPPLADAEYSKAFSAHFKRGDVQAALNKGSDADGGFLTPVEWDRTITDKMVEISPMRQICGRKSIGGTDYTKLFNLHGTASGWVGETDNRPKTATSKFASMTISTGELYANPAATQRLLDDAEINLEQWMGEEVRTEFSVQEAKAFISGDGLKKPSGFLSFITGGANANANPLGAIEIQATTTKTTVSEDTLLDLIYKLQSSYTQGSRFVMNRTTMGIIRKLRDADARQLWQPSTAAGQPSTLLAYPVTEMADMPDMAASKTPIAFGNFKRGYLIVDRMGIRVLRDPFTEKPNVLFYTTKRVGGAVIDTKAIKVLKMAT